jgi:PAS domain S-box-containing protein
MTGKHIWTEFPEGIDQPFYKAYFRAMAEQKYIHVEEYYPPYNKWFENHIYPSPDGLSVFFRDITEKKKTEIELQKQGFFIESIINASSDIIYIYDIEERKNIYVNDGIQSNLGYTNDEIKLMGDQVIPILMHPEDFEYYLHSTFPKYSRASDKEVISHTYRMKDKAGNWHWLDCKESVFLRRPDGSPKQLFGITTDITNRKKVEEAIINEKELSDKIINSLPGLFYLSDLTPGLRRWNKAFETYSGYSDEELGKIAPINLFDPGDHAALRQSLEKTYKEGKADAEVHLLTKSGKRIPFYFTGVSIEYEGKPAMLGIGIDNSERKKAERLIKESEEKYRTLVEQASDGIFIYDSAGNFLDANRYACTLSGYTKDELLKLKVYDVVEQKNLKETPFQFEEAQKGRTIINERKFITKDGRLIETELSSKLLPDGRFLGIARDITERKKAEEKLKEQAHQLSLFVEYSPAAIAMLDRDMKYLVFSKRWLTDYHLGDRDITGKSHYEIFPELPAHWKEVHQRCLAGATEKKEEDLFTRTDGRTDWVRWEIYPWYKTSGEAGGIILLTEVITERKKAELALAGSENYLRTILQTEPECVKILGPNGELLSMNPAGLAMIEADNEQQVLGHRMTELVEEKYRAGFNRLSKEVFKGNTGIFEFEITGLKGGHRWLETHAVPLKNAKGKIVNLLGVTRDITERKKAEAEIINTTIQLRRLTSHLQNIREEERKRIGREIHDELGQQLTAIKMDVAWIDKNTTGETGSIKSKLKNIITLLDGTNQSVRKILSELRPAILDDHGLLEALDWQGRQFTDSTGIPVKFTTAETNLRLPEEIATCIFRVYQESLTNITRYASAKKVLTSLSSNNDNIILSVEDDGKGFDTASVKNKKTFGLLGMKERVLSLNGKFELISANGKGTKILIRLPYKIPRP